MIISIMVVFPSMGYGWQELVIKDFADKECENAYPWGLTFGYDKKLSFSMDEFKRKEQRLDIFGFSLGHDLKDTIGDYHVFEKRDGIIILFPFEKDGVPRPFYQIFYNLFNVLSPINMSDEQGINQEGFLIRFLVKY